MRGEGCSPRWHHEIAVLIIQGIKGEIGVTGPHGPPGLKVRVLQMLYTLLVGRDWGMMMVVGVA